MTCPSGEGLIAEDRRRLPASVGFALSGQMGAFAFGMLCMVLTTRLLGPEGYGALAMFFLALAVLSQGAVSWPNLGMLRYGREELAGRGGMAASFWARAAIFLVSMGAAGALLWILRAPLERWLGLGFAPHFLLLAYLGLNEAVFLCRGVFQTASRFRAYAFSNTLVKLLIFAGLAALLVWSRGTGRTAGAAQVLNVHLGALGAALAVCLLMLPWRLLRPVRLDAAQAGRMLRYSWPLMLGGISVFVVDWVDLAVVKYYFGNGPEVGLYAAAYQPVTVLSQLRMAGIAALLPLVISMAVAERHSSLAWFVDEALPQAAWGIGLFCALAAGAAEAIPIVLGEKFSLSVVPAQVLMAGVAFSMLGAIQTAVAQALNRVRAAAAVTVALALFNAAGDLLLVPRIGILGAAVATSGSFALTGLLYFPILNGIGPLRSEAWHRRWLALAGMLPPLLIAILAVFLDGPLQRLVACAAVLVLTLAAAKAAGIFKRSTLERMTDLRMPGLARAAVRCFYAAMGK